MSLNPLFKVGAVKHGGMTRRRVSRSQSPFQSRGGQTLDRQEVDFVLGLNPLFKVGAVKLYPGKCLVRKGFFGLLRTKWAAEAPSGVLRLAWLSFASKNIK